MPADHIDDGGLGAGGQTFELVVQLIQRRTVLCHQGVAKGGVLCKHQRKRPLFLKDCP